MNKQLILQKAVFKILDAGVSNNKLSKISGIFHKEISKVLGKEKAKNFYIALHIEDDIYTLPYFVDERDHHPLDTPLSLKGGLTEYIKKLQKTKLIDKNTRNKLVKKGQLKAIGFNSYEWIGCPLMYKDEFFGVLAIQTYDKNIKYTKEDIGFIDFVSKNISFTLASKKIEYVLKKSKKNLERKISEKNKELEITNKKLRSEILKVKRNEKVQKTILYISQLKNKNMSIRELIKKIHKELLKLINVRNFYVAIKEGKEIGNFVIPFLKDEKFTTQNKEKLFKLPNSFTDYIYSNKEALLAKTKDIEAIEKNTIYKMAGVKPKVWVGIPLKTKQNNILGVLVVQDYYDEKAYSKTDFRLLRIISSTIADAIEFRHLENIKKKLEIELIKSQKLETVGIFAAGISHEFNNLLSIVLGNAYLGQINTEPNSQINKRFNKIIKTSEKAAELIDKLIVLAQFKKHKKGEKYQFGRILETIIERFKSDFIEMSFSLDMKKNLWEPDIDKDDLELILSNIFSNSIDAVNKRGKIDVSVNNYKDNKKNITSVEKHYLEIIIKDDGIGIETENINKVFDPFFTTKNPGEGTGLGLSIVNAIIREYEGMIKLSSIKNQGTIVKIYIPTIRKRGVKNG